MPLTSGLQVRDEGKQNELRTVEFGSDRMEAEDVDGEEEKLVQEEETMVDEAELMVQDELLHESDKLMVEEEEMMVEEKKTGNHDQSSEEDFHDQSAGEVVNEDLITTVSAIQVSTLVL
eukprot:759265-Hanusia_phi.AAC.1